MKAKILAVALAAVVLGAGGAQASTVQFTITSDTQPTISFHLPQSPDPGLLYDPGYGFEIDNVSIKVNGASGGTDDFVFANSAVGGGLADTVYFTFPTSFPGIFADQLYSGLESTPTFILGVFPGTYVDSDDSDASLLNTQITIAAIPLPAALPMLAGGLATLGLAGWRRKSKKAKAAAA